MEFVNLMYIGFGASCLILLVGYFVHLSFDILRAV